VPLDDWLQRYPQKSQSDLEMNRAYDYSVEIVICNSENKILLAMSTEGENTLAEEIKKYKTEDLINFLKEQEDLQLNDVHFKILREQEITGYNFLELTKEDFLSYGLKGGPATTLAKFVKECKEQKKKAFSSYRSLKDVLAKYNISSGAIKEIPQFSTGKVNIVLYNISLILTPYCFYKKPIKLTITIKNWSSV
jgi:hypothetical protein